MSSNAAINPVSSAPALAGETSYLMVPVPIGKVIPISNATRTCAPRVSVPADVAPNFIGLVHPPTTQPISQAPETSSAWMRMDSDPSRRNSAPEPAMNTDVMAAASSDARRKSDSNVMFSPCEHNDWDNVRVKKGVMMLRCRKCQAPWKCLADYAMEEKCQEFSKGNCHLGPNCLKLHLNMRKESLLHRVIHFGSNVLDKVPSHEWEKLVTDLPAKTRRPYPAQPIIIPFAPNSEVPQTAPTAPTAPTGPGVPPDATAERPVCRQNHRMNEQIIQQQLHMQMLYLKQKRAQRSSPQQSPKHDRVAPQPISQPTPLPPQPPQPQPQPVVLPTPLVPGAPPQQPSQLHQLQLQLQLQQLQIQSLLLMQHINTQQSLPQSTPAPPAPIVVPTSGAMQAPVADFPPEETADDSDSPPSLPASPTQDFMAPLPLIDETKTSAPDIKNHFPLGKSTFPVNSVRGSEQGSDSLVSIQPVPLSPRTESTDPLLSSASHRTDFTDLNTCSMASSSSSWNIWGAPAFLVKPPMESDEGSPGPSVSSTPRTV